MNTWKNAFVSERLELRPMPWAAVEAIMSNERLPDWAEDFPAVGDRVIARMLQRTGPSEVGPGRPDPWFHRQVVERISRAVVGGIGFFGPPQGGEVEIGYGIVPSRQGVGYATEAVSMLVTTAWQDPGTDAVVANTDVENVASQRVLEKAGFTVEAEGNGMRWRLNRPPVGA
jgi:[ribosomal protein S5]-alanine N-acetyltransferase